MVGSKERLRPLWWVTPVGGLLLVAPLSLALAATRSDTSFRRLWGTPKYLTTSGVELFAAAGLVFVVGVLIVMNLSARQGWRWVERIRELRPLLISASGPLFWITMTGYVAYVGLAGYRGVGPSDLALVFSDAPGILLKDRIGTLPGVTTLTQVGVATAVTCALVLGSGWHRQTCVRLAIVSLTASARALLLSERLALLEVMVPVAVVLFTAGSTSLRRRNVLGAAPIAMLPVLAGFFALFEYFRSWDFYRQQDNNGFTQFVLDRFAGYYATAYNNGQIFLEFGTFPGRLPYDTLAGLWAAPGLAQAGLYDRLASGSATNAYQAALAQHGNPEFNNPGGFAQPFVDWGVLGGLTWFFVAGLAVGWLYCAFRAGSLFGLLLYPVAFTGVLELPRYVYWSQGRTTPAVVGLLATALWIRRQRVTATLRT